MNEVSAVGEVYFDRNQAVMLAAELAKRAGYEAGIYEDAGEPDWWVLFIELPTGQVSWHIPKRELSGRWDLDGNVWDGHTVGQKRQRIDAFLRQGDVP